MKKIKNWFKAIIKELKSVKWPTKKDMVKYSVATISFIIVFALLFYGLDWLITFIRSL